MTSAKKAASIAARSTVRARSIHSSRSFNSAWRAWRVVFMPKGEYAGVWRGVSGSFHSDGVSRSRGRPPDSYAWSALSSVSVRRDLREHLQVLVDAGEPGAHRVHGGVGRTGRAPALGDRDEPVQLACPVQPWLQAIVAGSRPASVAACATTRAAVSNSASGPIVRESLWSWVFRPPTPTMVRFE